MRDLVQALLERAKLGISLEGFEPRELLAAAYAAMLCGKENCSQETAVVSSLAYHYAKRSQTLPSWARKLPRHIAYHVEKSVQEALEAYLRSPPSIYAQVVLDSEALSWIGALGVSVGGAASLSELLNNAAYSISYAAALDYIAYTSTAKRLAPLLRPRAMATAKWLTEELKLHGFEARLRVEQTTAGLIGLIDILSCPCGKAVKTVEVKPRRECIEYRVEYDCGACGVYRVKLCSPESTRIR